MNTAPIWCLNQIRTFRYANQIEMISANEDTERNRKAK